MGDIAKLIAAADTRGKTYTPPKTIAARIEADLKAVLKAAELGKAIPSQKTLAEYFQDSYKVPASRYFVAKWLQQVKNGKRVA